MKKIILSTIAALIATGSIFASYGTAAAQDYPYRPRYDRGYDRGGPPRRPIANTAATMMAQRLPAALPQASSAA